MLSIQTHRGIRQVMVHRLNRAAMQSKTKVIHFENKGPIPCMRSGKYP